MAQLPLPETRDLTASVQDYAKAIFTLESRHGAAVHERRSPRCSSVRPGSVSGMLASSRRLGLVEHERYRGVRLTEHGRRVALEVIRHHRLLELFLVESLGMTVGRGARRGRGARARALRGARGADRRASSATRRSTRTATRSRLATSSSPRRRGRRWPSSSRATGRRSSASPTPTPRCSASSASAGSCSGARLELVERQPFGGPLFVRFGDEVHALGHDARRARCASSGRKSPEPHEA